MPPFVSKTSLGVYPIESILGVIEVKTNLTKASILETEKKFQYLLDEICNPKYAYQKTQALSPICSIIGFYGSGPKQLLKSDGNLWLYENLKSLIFVCLVGKYSWVNTKKNGWCVSNHDETYEETKRFIAVLLDNIRTISTKTSYYLDSFHKDWLGIYIRDQETIRDYFKKI